MIDFRELWQLNRRWRQWMAANSEFVTPGTIDTLRYCRIECNEAADVELRNQLSKHPRNNGRDNTVHEELADALMLALTALPDHEYILEATPQNVSIDEICDLASQSVISFSANSKPEWWWHVADMIAAVGRYPGMNTEAELRKCWHRLAWKHASKAMASYPEELK